eukprot:Phypoly_transcript_03629.p1 GENE.Phypoly_transcript_03629~~Phypoly_transcript_03629.p1  ORF type:complete len:666 (+),score=121.00 Phypoly_transcript_03629:230-2227(+)
MSGNPPMEVNIPATRVIGSSQPSPTSSSSPASPRGLSTTPASSSPVPASRGLASSNSFSSIGSSSPSSAPGTPDSSRWSIYTRKEPEKEKPKADGAMESPKELPRSESVSTFKSARPSTEREFSAKEIANMDLHSLSTAKLDMIFKRVMNEMGIPDVSRSDMMTMSNEDKIQMIETRIPPQRLSPQATADPVDAQMPDIEELNRVFIVLLNELNIPSDRQQMMMMLPAAKKWLLITEHREKITKPELNAKALEKDTSSPRYYITLLESRVMPKDDLTNLRLSISARPVAWSKEFIALGGIPLLGLNVKDKILKEQKSGTDIIMELEILTIFKALMNVNDGMETILMRADISSILVQLISSSDMKIKTLLVEIFAVLCAVSQKGYRQVIIAFKLLKEIHHEDKRFSTMVKSLTFNNATPEYLVGAMTLINCIVNIPEEISSRIRMRSEFLQLGLLNIIKTLRGHSNDLLMVQLDIFEDEMERDAMDIKKKGGTITQLNEDDPAKIFAFLKTSVSNTPYYEPFLQTMQYLLDFTMDVAHGPKIWETFKSLAIQYLQMRDSQELLEEDEVALCPKGTAQYTKMKNEYTRQIDAMGKMLTATVQQVTSFKRDREEKNKIIAMLMTQIKPRFSAFYELRFTCCGPRRVPWTAPADGRTRTEGRQRKRRFL